MRLGDWGPGLSLALLFSGASTEGPTPFADYGHTNNVPPPIPREPQWILLALAAAIWLFSVAPTVWRANRRRLPRPLQGRLANRSQFGLNLFSAEAARPVRGRST